MLLHYAEDGIRKSFGIMQWLKCPVYKGFVVQKTDDSKLSSVCHHFVELITNFKERSALSQQQPYYQKQKGSAPIREPSPISFQIFVPNLFFIIPLISN